MVVKYKWRHCPIQQIFEMQGHEDITMVHIATYTLSTMANAIPCSQFQKKIQILWEPISFAYLSNC